MLYDSRGFTAADYARRTLAGWEASPGHRQNLHDAARSPRSASPSPRPAANDPRYVAVQLFGRPQALKYTLQDRQQAAGHRGLRFAGKDHAVAPRQIITHTACAAGTISFKLDARSGVGRYEARDGQVYTLKPREGGGVQVDVEPERALTP